MKVKISEIAKLHPGISYSSTDYSNKENGNVFINLKCIQRGGGFSVRGIKYYKGEFKTKHILKEGDLIIAITDLTKDALVVGAPLFLPKIETDKPILMSMDLARIEVDETIIDKEFFAYFLMQPFMRRFMKENSRGTTVLHLDKDAFLNLEIEIPQDKNVQKNIATILNNIDKNISLTKEKIVKLDQLKIGLYDKLFEVKDSE